MAATGLASVRYRDTVVSIKGYAGDVTLSRQRRKSSSVKRKLNVISRFSMC